MTVTADPQSAERLIEPSNIYITSHDLAHYIFNDTFSHVPYGSRPQPRNCRARGLIVPSIDI